MSWHALEAVRPLRGLSMGERLILLELARWYKDDLGTTYRAQAKLADELEIAPRNVIRILARLSQRGLVIPAQPSAGRRAARYRIPAVENFRSPDVASPLRTTDSALVGVTLEPVGVTLGARSPDATSPDLRDLELERERKKRTAACAAGLSTRSKTKTTKTPTRPSLPRGPKGWTPMPPAELEAHARASSTRRRAGERTRRTPTPDASPYVTAGANALALTYAAPPMNLDTRPAPSRLFCVDCNGVLGDYDAMDHYRQHHTLKAVPA